MIQVVCPKCHAVIAQGDFNQSTDLALFRQCEKGLLHSHPLSAVTADLQHPPNGAWYREDGGIAEIGAQYDSLWVRQFRTSVLLAAPAAPVDVTHPPAGAWYHQGPDAVEIGATTRSAIALLWVPLAMISVLVSVVWLIGGAAQVACGGFHQLELLFGGLFIFLVLSFVCVRAAALRVAGQVRVTMGRHCLWVFTGINGLGRSKQILLRDIVDVSGRVPGDITIDGPTSHYRFGGWLSRARRDFVLQALRQALSDRNDWLPPLTPASVSPVKAPAAPPRLPDYLGPTAASGCE